MADSGIFSSLTILPLLIESSNNISNLYGFCSLLPNTKKNKSFAIFSHSLSITEQVLQHTYIHISVYKSANQLKKMMFFMDIQLVGIFSFLNIVIKQKSSFFLF